MFRRYCDISLICAYQEVRGWVEEQRHAGLDKVGTCEGGCVIAGALKLLKRDPHRLSQPCCLYFLNGSLAHVIELIELSCKDLETGL